MKDLSELYQILDMNEKVIETNKNKTTEEYFKNNYFSIDAFQKKYALNESETYFQALERVCDFIASVEKTKEQKDYWKHRWISETLDNWWHPAGTWPCVGADRQAPPRGW